MGIRMFELYVYVTWSPYLGPLGHCWVLVLNTVGGADTPCARARGNGGGFMTDINFRFLFCNCSILFSYSLISKLLSIISSRSFPTSLRSKLNSWFSTSSTFFSIFSYWSIMSSFRRNSVRKKSLSFAWISICRQRSLKVLSKRATVLLNASNFTVVPWTRMKNHWEYTFWLALTSRASEISISE